MVNTKTMNERIPVKDALKLWIGEYYDDSDYQKYIKLKSIGCYNIFLEFFSQRGGGLLGGKNFVNFDNDTVDKRYFDLISSIKYNSNIVYTRKIKEVFSGDDDCDIDADPCDLLLLPYENESNTVVIIVDWKNIKHKTTSSKSKKNIWIESVMKYSDWKDYDDKNQIGRWFSGKWTKAGANVSLFSVKDIYDIDPFYNRVDPETYPNFLTYQLEF